MEEKKRPQFESSNIVFSVPTGQLEENSQKETPAAAKTMIPGKVIKRFSSESLDMMVLKHAEKIVEKSGVLSENIPVTPPSGRTRKSTMPLGMYDGGYEPVQPPVTEFNIIHAKTGEVIRVKPVFTIGAGDEADFTVSENGFLSRNHAKLRIEGSALLLEDTNSLNGTFLNGKKIENFTVQIKSGDSFMLANEEFVVK